MQPFEIESVKKIALSCAKAAGELSLQRMKEPYTVEFKTSASDLVTAVDKEIEQFVVKTILEQFPDHGILGEESTF